VPAFYPVWIFGTTFKSFHEIKIDTSIRYNKSYDPKPDEVVAENDFKKQEENEVLLLQRSISISLINLKFKVI